MGRDPNIMLLEAGFETFFELDKVLSVLWQIGHVHKNSDQIIAVVLSRVRPLTANRLRLTRNRAKLLLQLEQRVGDQFAWDLGPVIEPKRQQHFVAPVWRVHRWPALLRRMEFPPWPVHPAPPRERAFPRIGKS